MIKNARTSNFAHGSAKEWVAQMFLHPATTVCPDVVGQPIWPRQLAQRLAGTDADTNPAPVETDAVDIVRRPPCRAPRTTRPAFAITLRKAAEATTRLQRTPSVQHILQAANLALAFDGSDGLVEIQVELLRLSLLTKVNWPVLIANHPETASQLLTKLVIAELSVPIKFTLPIMQPELLKFLPPEILPRLLDLTLRRIKAVALNVDKALALQSLTPFERYSLHVAHLFLPALMEEAAQLLRRGLVAGPTQEALTRVLGKYNLNREEYKLYTEILARLL